MRLTEEQGQITDQILSFPRQVQTLGGYAGTGKTFCVSYLHRKLKDFAVCAFTGKASNVLRKRGIGGAQTIHKTIYAPMLDDRGKIILDDYGRPIFDLKKHLEYDGLIVDEASMVNDVIYEDLLSFGKPLIFVGDHGQLEPVGCDVNLMKSPDYRLEEIHRNAGEIAWFADHIRNGRNPAAYRHKYPANIDFVDRFQYKKYLTNVDQIICAYNKTRVKINKEVREAFGYKSNWPVEGDRIMCLRNNYLRGLFNGMQGQLVSFGKAKNHIDFYSDGGSYDLYFEPSSFNSEKPEISMSRNDPDPFEYAYCITAHKSQGDEWGTVMVIEQKCDNWDHKRWAYTAASRAKDKLIWVCA